MIKLVYDSITYDDEIVAGKGSISMQHAMVGETLSVDSVIIAIMTDTAPTYTANAPGLVYNNDTLIGKYYLSEMHQTDTDEYELTFLSAIKLLDQSRHQGGLYSATPAGDIIGEIMGDIDYSIDADVEAVLVYEYLPYDYRRPNLNKLLMAIGGAVRYLSDGSFNITSLSDVSAGTFGLSRVFEGGKLIDKSPASGVQITEHTYIETTEEITLFNGATVSTETIIFSEPIHDLSITGGTIDDSGVNFCTFTGSGTVLLKGQKYQHVTRVITEGYLTGRVVSVTGNTLLGPNNAAEVAERLYDFVSVAQSIQAEVIFGTERPGDVVSVIHPYTRLPVTATIKEMEVQIGQEIRANAEFLVGYVPPSLIAGFEHYVILTGTGNWTVPAGVTKGRAIIVGSGAGGAGGNNGLSSTSNYDGKAGGDPGDGGNGGLILDVSISLAPGVSISYDCGVGGAGGAPETSGSAGEATTFGGYSSEYGRTYPYGYEELKSGLLLCAKGSTGIKGGTGNGLTQPPNPISSIEYKETTYVCGSKGDDNYFEPWDTMTYGGYGGGPAAGNNGGDGGDMIPGGVDQHDFYPEYFPPGSMAPAGGKGGDGADAVDADDATGYGTGGPGGHGGGGAGGSADYLLGGRGTGGSGGYGGDGAPGCVIVLY